MHVIHLYLNISYSLRKVIVDSPNYVNSERVSYVFISFQKLNVFKNFIHLGNIVFSQFMQKFVKCFFFVTPKFNDSKIVKPSKGVLE